MGLSQDLNVSPPPSPLFQHPHLALVTQCSLEMDQVVQLESQTQIQIEVFFSFLPLLLIKTQLTPKIMGTRCPEL